ncbi:hypothetical protein E4S40_09670 [Algoriphagus kandeliae]|uniref:Uncharacterized protein n=1 Tax=Algoriphagus kandeliae TaxID=2562278 RepID=A0A4Y9QNS9_9BACT|nr:hypothetical protein [Algoriphagus kandeliae]TFV94294.1 hypothetical protein E4S40_09670 [Algoriphagus kandeliae]
MLIQTRTARFLISNISEKQGVLLVQSDNKDEMERLFGSEEIKKVQGNPWPYEVSICKQELAHCLILLVKEIDYKEFRQLSDFI